MVVPRGVLDADDAESVIVLGIHADLSHLVHIDDGDVEHRASLGKRGKTSSDDIILAFQRGINLSVRGIERHRPKMSLNPVDGAEYLPFHVSLDETGREREVHAAYSLVIGDSLNVVLRAFNVNLCRKILFRL